MVRRKSSPLRSLKEVDYSDPKVTIWFFGQQTSFKQPLEHIPPVIKEVVVVQIPPKKPAKQNKQTETVISESLSKNESMTHPLLGTPNDLPPLTDLQVFITEAILCEEGSTCPFERIYDYVSKRWRYIRRRDGSNYTTDCRRAIQANLRHNPNHVALFRRDKNKQGNWTVCKTMEDAVEASKERQAERRASRRDKEDRMLGSDGGKENDDDKEDSMSESEQSPPVVATEVKQTPPTISPPEKTNGADLAESESEKEEDVKEEEIEEEGEGEEPVNDPEEEEVPEEGADESADEEGDDEEEIRDEKKPDKREFKETKLTPLQTMICECINDNGGSCHFDLIVHHVAKGWNRIKTGNADAKTAILSALTDSKKIFKRDTKRTGWWIINKDLEGVVHVDDNPFSRSSRSKSRDAMKKMQTTSSPSSKKVKVEDHSEEEEKKEDDRKEKDPPMTELQILIIEAIDMSEGSASFEQIFDHVQKKFDNLRRRDGTPYTSECRRAIQASLSNNPTTRPFFKKEMRKGNAMWSLAKRSIEFLDDYKRNKGNESEESEEEESKEKDEKGSSDEDDDDDDDEDAKEDDSSEESEKDDEEEQKKKVEPKDDKHLYPNRQKRARSIKEKAEVTKRQLRETTETSRTDLRRKRRK